MLLLGFTEEKYSKARLTQTRYYTTRVKLRTAITQDITLN